MKKYIKSTLLMLMSVCLFTACSDDNGSNPDYVKPTQFVLNAPGLADQEIDLANSSSVVLTCSQPDYGYPAATTYTVYVASKEDMSDAVLLSTKSASCKIELDAQEIAAAVTNMKVADGVAEEDFPMVTPIFFQAEAVQTTTTGGVLEDSRIKSNVVSLNKVNLEFSLPPVLIPENVYLIGEFCGWDWSKCATMVPVYGTDNVFWRMVYIGEGGIKLNTDMAWNGNEVGFSGITVDPESELGDDIQATSDGNIASKNPGWYLVIAKGEVEGRNVKWTLTFNEPIIRFIGTLIGGWDEGKGEPFTVPATADGDFVSPAMIATAGTEADGCVRMYVKVPGYDWWKSEFIVGLDGDNISYRGKGGDQDRVGSEDGQHVYLNFGTDTGKIE